MLLLRSCSSSSASVVDIPSGVKKTNKKNPEGIYLLAEVGLHCDVISVYATMCSSEPQFA